jgi:ParB family chromosome partitioning protein
MAVKFLSTLVVFYCQAVAIAEAVEPKEKKEAERRVKTGRPPGGKFPQGSVGKTRDKVAKYTGMSAGTLEKAMQTW